MGYSYNYINRYNNMVDFKMINNGLCSLRGDKVENNPKPFSVAGLLFCCSLPLNYNYNSPLFTKKGHESRKLWFFKKSTSFIGPLFTIFPTLNYIN